MPRGEPGWRLSGHSPEPPCPWCFRTQPDRSGSLLSTRTATAGAGAPNAPLNTAAARLPAPRGRRAVLISLRLPSSLPRTRNYRFLSSRSSAAPDLGPAPCVLCNYKLIAEMNFLLAPGSSTDPPFSPDSPHPPAPG